MFKVFEWIGGIIAITALIQFAADPKKALDEIAQGPAPHLAQFNDQLMGLHISTVAHKKTKRKKTTRAYHADITSVKPEFNKTSIFE